MLSALSAANSVQRRVPLLAEEHQGEPAMFHLPHHGPVSRARDPMQTVHRHLIQALSIGVLLLVANAAVVILVN